MGFFRLGRVGLGLGGGAFFMVRGANPSVRVVVNGGGDDDWGEKALLPLLGRNQRWTQGRACCSLGFTPPLGDESPNRM